MRPPREMSPQLLDYFEGAGKTYFPNSLLRGFRPPLRSAFSIIHPEPAHTLSCETMFKLDTSFPAQMRDALQAGLFTEETAVIVTARSGIPAADAIRGFAEAVGIIDVTLTNAPRNPPVPPLSHVSLVDVFTYTSS